MDGFDLTIDGESLMLQPAMQQVVAMVALAPRGIKRECVAFQLWPDKTEERAKANLRSCLWRIGKLPVAPIVSSKSTLWLSQDLWTDVREGLEELASGDETDLGPTLLPFHTLQADLLPDWYGDWLLVERERLRRFRIDVLERRARAALDSGAPSTAIQLALAAVAMDPYRAGGHQLAVEAHLAEGNTVEAHREYDRYRHFAGLGSQQPAFHEWTGSAPVTVR